MNTGGFNWVSLGKADYSQTYAMVASLPEPIRRKLTRSMMEVLCRIMFLCWRFAQTSGRGSAYCIPSERYLAQAIGRSERTVRRCLIALRNLGLVTWVRRGMGTATWLSNLYKIGPSFLANCYATAKKKLKQFQRRTQMADNDLKREYKAAPPPSAKPFIPPDWMLSRAKAQTSSWDSSEISAHRLEKETIQAIVATEPHVPADEWDIADAKSAETERRELLRKQAESLRKRGL